MDNTNMRQFFRLREVIEIFGVSRSCWWKWVSAGRAPKPVRIGPRTSRWRRADIERMIAEINAAYDIGEGKEDGRRDVGLKGGR